MEAWACSIISDPTASAGSFRVAACAPAELAMSIVFLSVVFRSFCSVLAPIDNSGASLTIAFRRWGGRSTRLLARQPTVNTAPVGTDMAKAKAVLIAEDNETDAFLLRRAFAKARVSATLHFVRDGQEAIDYLKGEGGLSDRTAHPFPDVVLLDEKMPRLNGTSVLEWVRNQPSLRQLPVIMLSSSGLTMDIDRAYQLGVDAYMVKPLDLEELCAIVETVKRRWLEPGAETGPSAGQQAL